MPKQYTISETCPPEQKKVFAAINRILTATDSTTEEFESNFRADLLHSCQDVVEHAAAAFMIKLGHADNMPNGVMPSLENAAKWGEYFDLQARDTETLKIDNIEAGDGLVIQGNLLVTVSDKKPQEKDLPAIVERISQRWKNNYPLKLIIIRGG